MLTPMRGIFFLRILWSLSLARGLMCQVGVNITRCPLFQENAHNTLEALINTSVIEEKKGCIQDFKTLSEIVSRDKYGIPQYECRYKVGTCSFVNTGDPKCGCTQETGSIYRYTLQFTARKKTHEGGSIIFRSNCQKPLGVFLIQDRCPIKFRLSVLSECPKRGYIDGIPSTQNCTLSADWTQQCTDDNTTVKFVLFDTRSQKAELCTVPYQKDTCTESFTPGDSCPTCRCRCTEHNGTIRYTLFFTPTIAKYNRASEMSCATECSDKLFGASLVHCVNISVSPNICYGAKTLCHNGGTCQYDGNSEHGYVCKCATGYSGRLCDTDPCEEEDNPCRNGGTCVLEKSNPELFSCTCRAEYEGNYCQYPAPDTILTASRSSTASTSWTTAVVLAVGSSISFC